MQKLSDKIFSVFMQNFKRAPQLVRSPGRVNLIGEHTDYNEGFVLPATIDRAIYMAIDRRDDRYYKIVAADFDEMVEGSLDDLQRSGKNWENYILGVVKFMQQAGNSPGGFDCVFGGDIPLAAGLSSSAALEGAVSFALNELYDLGYNRLDLVRIGQAAENKFVGVQCGIMDQFINMFGKKKALVKLDCRTLEYEHIDLPEEKISLVLCDTGIKRALASSDYNARRKQCEEGVRIIRKAYSEVVSLRDVSLYMLDLMLPKMDAVVFKRCDYVIQENIRLLNGCRHLEEGNLEAFGEEMYKSHRGLRDDFEVSCPELDVLVNLAKDVAGVYGARMMGAGFGGCTINLVKSSETENFTKKISQDYKKETGKDTNIYICSTSDGTQML